MTVVVIALGRAARQHGAGRLGNVVALAGIGAVTVSLVGAPSGSYSPLPRFPTARPTAPARCFT